MTINDAKQNISNYYNIKLPSEADDFVYVESLEYLIKNTNLPNYMLELGGYYYEKEKFNLALKYYEMAEMLGDENAILCLGYIWYYGRTGTKDYKKAFEYFEKGMKKGNIVSTYKVADMYRNGYYVEKDYEKYKSIIKKLYFDVKDFDNCHSPLVEVFTRLAKIKIEEEKYEEALSLLIQARIHLEERIIDDPFFGNFTIMKYLIYDLYSIAEFNRTSFNLYDLYEVFKKPHKVSFMYMNKKYFINSSLEDGNVIIEFGNKWFKSVDDFLKKAVIDNKRLTNIFYKFENFKLLE